MLRCHWAIGSIFYKSIRAMICLLWAMLLSFQAMLPVHLSTVCVCPFAMALFPLSYKLCFFVLMLRFLWVVPFSWALYSELFSLSFELWTLSYSLFPLSSGLWAIISFLWALYSELFSLSFELWSLHELFSLSFEQCCTSFDSNLSKLRFLREICCISC